MSIVSVENETEEALDQMPGDGGDAQASKEDLTAFIEDLRDVCRQGGDVIQRRKLSEDTRFCRWEGQAPDGLKHRDHLDGEEAFPFEGASDARVRTADKITNFQVAVVVAAALRGQLQVKGLLTADGGYGARMKIILRWALKNQLGSSLLRELTRLANYVMGDAPAGALLGVFWEQTEALRYQTFKLEEVPKALHALGMPEPDILDFMQALQDPTRDGELIPVLESYGLKKARAKTAIKELREEGVTRIPMVYVKENRPRIVALRLYDDVFVPGNTTDLPSARFVCHREWLSKVELQERVRTHGYAEGWVEEVLKHEGRTSVPYWQPTGQKAGDGSMQYEETKDSPHERRGLYEVITRYYWAANEDGVVSMYYLTFSGNVPEMAATDRALLDYAHGGYPFVWYGKEFITSRLLDSRGTPELVMTEQKAQKMLEDSFRDHVSLTTVPPIKVPRSRARTQLVIGPMKEIKENRPGEVSWMNPPQYPNANVVQQLAIDRRLAEYTGLPHGEVAPAWTVLIQQMMVDLWLGSHADALLMLLQLCQQYLDDEQLQGILGPEGVPVAKTLEDIAGKFSVEVTFAAGALDVEYVMKLAEIISKYILPIDSLSTVQRDALVAVLFQNLDPSLADAVLVPVEAANQKEIEEEEMNFTKIFSGVEPPMMKEGQNFKLRLEVLEGIPMKNPEAYQKLTPVSRAIYDARREHLRNQVQQQKNAVIGRQVGQPALS